MENVLCTILWVYTLFWTAIEILLGRNEKSTNSTWSTKPGEVQGILNLARDKNYLLKKKTHERFQKPIIVHTRSPLYPRKKPFSSTGFTIINWIMSRNFLIHKNSTAPLLASQIFQIIICYISNKPCRCFFVERRGR